MLVAVVLAVLASWWSSWSSGARVLVVLVVFVVVVVVVVVVIVMVVVVLSLLGDLRWHNGIISATSALVACGVVVAVDDWQCRSTEMVSLSSLWHRGYPTCIGSKEVDVVVEAVNNSRKRFGRT